MVAMAVVVRTYGMIVNTVSGVSIAVLVHPGDAGRSLSLSC